MGELTRVSIDFQTSHLIFPTVIGTILALLGLAILVSRRAAILTAGATWSRTFARMDKLRLFGTLALTVLYFSLMVPIGDLWPNTGLGFLVCSIPFVGLTGLLFMHERGFRHLLPLVVVALVAPTLVWWLFTDVFFLTLP